ncbi:MAG: nucleotidyltransferase family protein, partial [Microcoleus sp. SIO2G3]|nr:nucleotidyltransferase family protein [Microcoleus sp. SIO2G3]
MQTPLVGLIILAAGASTRMGTPKQLLTYQNRSLLRHTAEVAIASCCHPIAVVLGAQIDRIAPEVNELDLHVVENKQWAEGMGTSIQAGLTTLTAIEPNLSAVMLLLCDQPFVSADLLNQIVEAYCSTGRAIVACEYV